MLTAVTDCAANGTRLIHRVRLEPGADAFAASLEEGSALPVPTRALGHLRDLHGESGRTHGEHAL